MFRGAWHQCGDRSQILVEEQLQNGTGGGVVLSPRDLSRPRALEYAQRYRALGAEILLDNQFYVPGFTNPKFNSYPISALRASISSLNRITDTELNEFSNHLRIDHQELCANALLAPAVVYEAGRPEVVSLNERLFGAAKQVGDQLHIPTYATVVLGRSVAASDQTIAPVLSQVTALNSDGWYFAFEFEDQRLPSAQDSVRRCCAAGLTLACTGKPVLHAYAGPLGLLSFGFGATGIGIGHSQNTWRYTRDRWQPPGAQGGGGDAPPRFFSSSLWGTIIYPDETSLLPAPIRTQVITPSSFSAAVVANLAWDRWLSGKHLVNILATTFTAMAGTQDPRANAQVAISRLQQAVALHQTIQQNGVFLADNTNVYQENWRLAMQEVLQDRSADFDYLDLLL
jgi:hypothetical protein